MSILFEGLDEYVSELNKVINEYPNKAEELLIKQGKDFKKSVIAKTPDSGISH